MKKILNVSLISLVALSVVACNTVSGVGQDIKAGGKAIQNAASKTKESINKKMFN